MAVTIPNYPVIIQPQQLVQPPMTDTVVAAALANTNHLWRWWTPPLIDCCPSQSSTAAGVTQRFVTPLPSRPINWPQIVHRCNAVVVTSTTATVTLDVEYTTSWVSIGGSSWTSIGTDSQSINGRGELSVAGSIPINAVALRWVLTSSTGTYVTHHVLATPEDDSIDGGDPTQGGFVAYDDGLLESGDQPPINTEMLNRVTRNLYWLRRTRPQAALSYVQPESSTYGQDPTTVSGVHQMARVRVWLGCRPAGTMTFAVIGASTGGSVRIEQVSGGGQNVAGQSATANLDGTIRTATLQLTAQGAGVLRFAELLVVINAGSSTATLYSLHGWITGG